MQAQQTKSKILKKNKRKNKKMEKNPLKTKIRKKNLKDIIIKIN